MFNRVGALISFVLIGMNTGAMAGGVNMNPGMWEWTATMEIPGMPMQMPPSSYSACITAADIVPKDNKMGQDCETVDLQTDGDTVSWSMTCTTTQGVTTSKGQITYNGDSASGESQVNTQGMQMTTKTTGRRLGPCQ